MISEQVFRSKIDDFTKELCGKTYINRSLGVLYEKLNYLTNQDLDSALRTAAFEFPQNILPIPVKLYEFIAFRFKRRESDNRVFNNGKYCRACGDTGQVETTMIGELYNPTRYFRCFCDRGKQFNEEYFPTWRKRYETKYKPNYKPNNQDNAGYSEDATHFHNPSIIDYDIFKKIDDYTGLNLYIDKSELSQLEIDLCKKE